MSDSVTIHLFSSGIDSILGMYYLQEEIQPNNLQFVYFDLKHRYSKAEIITIRQYYPFVRIESLLDLSTIERPDAFIPNRNILLVLTAASLFIKYDEITIYINGMKDDNVNDQNRPLWMHVSAILENMYPGKIITVKSVFNYQWSKFQAIDWFKTKHDASILNNTFSCYNPINFTEHCYRCPACLRRNVALYYAGIYKPFYNYELLMQYERKMKDTNTHYTDDRREATLNYINYVKQKEVH